MTAELVTAGRKIAERIRDEVKAATRAWTLIEAFNGRDPEHRQALHNSLNRAGLGITANVLLRALFRDAMSALFRVSDDPGGKGERQSLCALIPLLANPDVIAALEEETNFPEFLAEENLALVRSSIAHLKGNVSERWKGAAPSNSTLLDLRTRLRPVRDGLLAHALDYSGIQQATFGEMRQFLQIINELEYSASMAFHCLSESRQERWDIALKHAHRFWDLVERGSQTYLETETPDTEQLKDSNTALG